MEQVFIWGVGRYAKNVLRAMNEELCCVCGFLDSNKGTKEVFEGYPLYLPGDIPGNYDWIVVSARQAIDSIKDTAKNNRIPFEKLIFFFQDDISRYAFIDKYAKTALYYKEQNDILKRKINNIKYEIMPNNSFIIRSSEQALKKIIKERKSLSRFGDGELELMCNRARPWFQEPNEDLANRLNEVINSNNEDVIIAVGDNFGNLDKYTDEAADGIREYLSDGIRESVLEVIPSGRVYYNNYMTRPYIIYKEKETHAEKIFSLWKKLFYNRNILFVEGKYVRNGMGNDLFDTANRVRRIVCPEKNAFRLYQRILDSIICRAEKSELVLISLGPTATVLAYDCAKEGIQALDIGQLDVEYEWFIEKASKRQDVNGKGVAELPGEHYPKEEPRREYLDEIIVTIEE